MLFAAGCGSSSFPAPVTEVSAAEMLILEGDPPKSARPEEHRTLPGDSLASIALEYGLDYRELASWNNLSPPYAIYPGQSLRLLPDEAAPAPQSVPLSDVLTPLEPPSEAPDILSPVPLSPAPVLSPEPQIRPAVPLTPLALDIAPAAPAAQAAAPALQAAAPAAQSAAPIAQAAAPLASQAASGAVQAAASPATSAARAADAALLASQVIAPIAGAIVPDAEPAPAAPVEIPTKTGPVAEKFAYSPDKLKELQAAHGLIPPAPPIVTPPIVAPPVAPAVAAALPKPPTQTRRRYNMDWSWPVRGNVLEEFSAASKGMDIAGNLGDPIHAIADGRVMYVGSKVKGYGRMVILKHDNDYLSAYAHTSEILVQEGASIQRGQPIAAIGDSGASKVMLHFEVRKAGSPFNPRQVLPSSP